MTTRRQMIRILPTLPVWTAAGATALLAACGDKKPVNVAAPAASPPAVAAAPAAPAAPAAADVAAGALVDEKAPAAVALGYIADASKVDKTKHPQYVAGSACANCALYQGAADSAQGGCPLFPGKQVLGKAWCNAWAKKVA